MATQRIVLVSLLILTGLILVAGSGTAASLPLTRITVDGTTADWNGRAVLTNDPAGDAEAGSVDFATGYAFVNRNALYFLIEVVDSTAPVVQFDIFLRVDNRQYLVSWVPGSSTAGHADITNGFKYLGPTNYSSFAFGPALEGRIDLRDLGSPQQVQLIQVMAMVGTCCDSPAWHPADGWVANQSTPVVNEKDAPQTERAARPGHIAMSDPQLKAQYAYRSFLQLPQCIAGGPDGKLYIADQSGRHIVRLSPDGQMDDVGIWHDPSMWTSGGPYDVGFDSHGNLYVAGPSQIYEVNSEKRAEALPGIFGVNDFTFGPNDVLYFTRIDPASGGGVWKRNADGSISTVATGIPNADDLIFGPDGTLYVSELGLASVVRVDVATGQVRPFARTEESVGPVYLAVDHEGDVWIRGMNTLYQVSPSGHLKPFVVDGTRFSGGDASALALETPGGIAFDDQGRLWITSYNSSVRVLEPVTPGVADSPMRSRLVVPGFCPGLVGGDIEIDRNGNVYAYNSNPSPGEVWRIAPNGTVDVLYRVKDRGNVGMALDKSGRLYLGLPSGEIVWLDSQGQAHHFDWLHAWSMTFGTDGYLYAVAGQGGEPRSIVRITGQDRHVTLLARFNGKPLGGANEFGPGDVYIAAAPQGGLYVYDGTQKEIYFLAFNGTARLFSDDPRIKMIRGPAPLAVSPNGDVFINLNDVPTEYGYSLLRIAPDGAARFYASGIYGDPLAMVVSPDGKWLYISENGSVDKLPLD